MNKISSNLSECSEDILIQHNFEKGYVKVFFSSKMSLYKLKTKRSNSELLGLSFLSNLSYSRFSNLFSEAICSVFCHKSKKS